MIPRRPAFFWASLAGGIVLLGLHAFPIALFMRFGNQTADWGWGAERRGANWVITTVERDGPAAGRLVPNDVLLAVDGETHIGPSLWLYLTSREGSRHSVRIRRGDGEEVVPLSVAAVTDPGRLWRSTIPSLVDGLGLIALAVLVAYLRPLDRVARLLSLAALANSSALLGFSLESYFGLLTWPEWVLAMVCGIAAPFQYALCFHFFSSFPPTIACAPGCRLVRKTLYAWAGAVWASWWLRVGLLAVDPRRARAIDVALPWLSAIERETTWPLIVVALSASILVMIRNYVKVTEPHAARQMRWIFVGSALGLVPEIVQGGTILWVQLMGPAAVADRLYDAATGASQWLGVLIPGVFAYAILRHRLLDVHVVVRRGVRYLLARGVLTAGLSLPLILLVLSVLSNPDATVSQVLFGHPLHLALAAAAGLSLRFRGPLTLWVDRHFFRTSYDREQILIQLIEDLKVCDSLAQVSAMVGQRIGAALYPSQIQVLYRDGIGRLVAGHSSDATVPGPQFFQASHLVGAMERSGAAEAISNLPLPPEEKALLEQHGVHFALPIGGGAEPLEGLILLGEKKSEEPYTATDAKLLTAVAAHMALACENLSLRERVASGEKVRREVLDRLEGRGLQPVRECASCGRCYDGSVDRCAADQQPLTLSLPVEQTIEGKYRLERLLGKGGMGAVYEATDLRLGRTVAVKVVIGHLFGDRESLKRFEREARTLAHLDHPNVVEVYDYGELGGGGAYLVMERLRGVTLRTELKGRGPVPPPSAADWFGQILSGLAAAHAQGVVHRDLKPENIFLADEGEGHIIKILDFGLALASFADDTGSAKITLPGSVFGTLLYMSPEQHAGRAMDVRTDIYSLGMILIEMLTGRNPLQGRNPATIRNAILYEEFHIPGESREIAALDTVLQRCLAKDPVGRFESIAQMSPPLLAALRACPRVEAGGGSAPVTASTKGVLAQHR